ncbi:MAG: OmpA family protein [Steroidobacteraceae bacterium]
MSRSNPRQAGLPVSTICLAVLGAAFTATAAYSQGIERDAAIISEQISNRVDAYIYKAGTRSKLEFRGTTLAGRAVGTARVVTEATRTSIEADFRDLPQPGTLGPYTVYMLWAITPEGRGNALGVLQLSRSGKAKIETVTPLNGFAMIVTAEPHFLVSVPSMQVVMRNIAVEFEGRTQPVTTLADRADYSGLAKLAPASKRPVQVEQATYAVEIAEAAGAATLAPGPLATAKQALDAADAAWRAKSSAERRRAPELGRVAMQAGEDARIAAVRRAEELKREAAQKDAEESQRRAEEARRLAEENARNAERAAALAATEAERAKNAEGAAARARAELLQRMNQVLPTRDTPRGLVAEIGGVQFATARATLESGARESLARLSGILSAYPELKLKIEGHTDNVGSAETNSRLSYERATAVRDYLASLGVPASSIDVDGLGPSNPVADNATAEGRARNRRVEVIVSGEGITPR